MSYTRKLVIQPFDAEEQQGEGIDVMGGIPTSIPEEQPKKKGNFIRDRALERQKKLLKIIMKLAKVDGYNSDFQIKLQNGSYLENSDIVTLLLHVLSPGKLVVGLREFVNLLHEAGVTPELLTNENAKSMLEKFNRSNPSPVVHKTLPINVEPEYEERQMPVLSDQRRPPIQRKRRLPEREEGETTEPQAKRSHQVWDENDSDEN